MKTCPPSVARMLAVSCIAFAASAAHAQSAALTVYGVMDAYAGSLQNPGGARINAINNGGMTTSFLGFRGNEDLGGGLKAMFSIESYLSLDTGAVPRFPNDSHWNRAAWVGLQGAYGTVSLGRQGTILAGATFRYSPFFNSVPFSPLLFQTATYLLTGDTAWNRSIKYVSPNLSGLTLGAQYTFANPAGPPGKHNSSISADYVNGPFAAGLVGERVATGLTFPAGGQVPATLEQQTAWQAGASYDFKVLKLFAAAQTYSNDAAIDNDSRVYQIGVSVPAGPGVMLASVAHADTTFADNSPSVSRATSVAGYHYFFSQRTSLYGLYRNDRLSTKGTGNSYALGMRHVF